MARGPRAIRHVRGPRALRHVDNQPTAHRARTARCGLGAVVCAWPTRDAPHPTPLAKALVHRHRAGSAAAASKPRIHLFLVPWRAARAPFVTWRTSRPPTEHALRAACLARLSARPTRVALRPSPLAEAPGGDTAPCRRLRLRTFVTVSFKSRGARPAARHSSRGEPADRPQSTHCALRTWRGCLRVANSRRAPPHAVGRGSSSPPPRRIGGCGFGPSYPSLSSSVACSPRLLFTDTAPDRRPCPASHYA